MATRITPIDLADAYGMHEFARRDLFIPTVARRIGRQVFHAGSKVRVVSGPGVTQPGGKLVGLPYTEQPAFMLAIENLLVNDTAISWHGFPILIFRVAKDPIGFLARQLRARQSTDWNRPATLPIHLVSFNPQEGNLTYVEDLRSGHAEYRYEPADPTYAQYWHHVVYAVRHSLNVH